MSSSFTVIMKAYHTCLDKGKYQWFRKTTVFNIHH